LTLSKQRLEPVFANSEKAGEGHTEF